MPTELPPRPSTYWNAAVRHYNSVIRLDFGVASQPLAPRGACHHDLEQQPGFGAIHHMFEHSHQGPILVKPLILLKAQDVVDDADDRALRPHLTYDNLKPGAEVLHRYRVVFANETREI